MTTTDKSNGQPEALATFAATARNAGRKPDDIGLEATPATEPVATSPGAKQDAATRVLQEGVTGKDHGSGEAIDALPDRIAQSGAGKASR